MRTSSRLILAGLASALLMALGVGAATAGRLSISNRNFRITWAALPFFPEESGLAIAITCPLTLEGSFHSATIRKVAGSLIGAVSRGIFKNESCTGGKATILQGALPWHLTYEGFSGTLPTITDVEVLLNRYALQFEYVLISVRLICLYSDHGNPEENLGLSLFRTGTGAMTTVFHTSGHLAFTSGSSELCFEFWTFEGPGNLFLLGNTTRISITLI